MFTCSLHHQQSVIQLTDTTTNTQVEVFCFGAILNKFVIAKNSKSYNVIDGYQSVEDAIQQKNTWFKSCLLAPFVGRLENGKYGWQNIDYTINKFYLGNNAIHGLVYDQMFTIVETKANSQMAKVILQHNYIANEDGYPFNFTLFVTYTLQANNKLSVHTKFFHSNSVAIPFCQGWHTYFNLHSPINNCCLQVQSNKIVECNNQSIPTKNIATDNRFLQPKLLQNIELDDCFLLNNNSVCSIKSSELEIFIVLLENYKYLQIFTPNHNNSIAIEPMSAAPNAFNNNMGLTIAQPQTEYHFKFEVVAK